MYNYSLKIKPRFSLSPPLYWTCVDPRQIDLCWSFSAVLKRQSLTSPGWLICFRLLLFSLRYSLNWRIVDNIKVIPSFFPNRAFYGQFWAVAPRQVELRLRWRGGDSSLAPTQHAYLACSSFSSFCSFCNLDAIKIFFPHSNVNMFSSSSQKKFQSNWSEQSLWSNTTGWTWYHYN